MNFDEAANSLHLAGSGWVTDTYDARSGAVTTNPMAAGFAPTCPLYAGGGYLGSPEHIYEPGRHLYSDEYAHQFPSSESYNAPPHFLNREIANDSFFDAAFVSSQALQVPSPSLALIDHLKPEPLPFEGYGSDDWDNEQIAQLRSESDTLPFYSSTDNPDYGCNAPATDYPTSGIDGNPCSLYPSETILQPVSKVSAAGMEAEASAPSHSSIFGGSLGEFMAEPKAVPGSPGQPAPFAMPGGSSRQPAPPSMIPQQPDYGLASSPYTVISPPSSVKSSPRKRSASAARIDKPVGPKKRVIKAHMLAKVDNIEDSKLKIETDKSPTFEYQEYFHSPADANMKLKRLLELFRKPEDNCSSPSTDSTFPQSNEDKKRYVEKLFNAINDWENINEWSQTLVPEERARVMKEHERMKIEANTATPGRKSNDIPLEEMRPSRDELPALDVQQKKILGRQLNDQTVEWLCWELIEAAIQSQQGYTQIPYWCGADGA